MIIIFEKMIVKLIEILFALEQHGNLGITDFTLIFQTPCQIQSL